MAYSDDYIEQSCIKAIEDNNLFWTEDIFAYVEFAKTTFYDHKIEESNAIKKALANNRIKTKQSLKSKWYKTKNPTLNIALYKLIGTPEEVERLSGTNQKIDHTSKGEKIIVIPPIVKPKETKETKETKEIKEIKETEEAEDG